MTDSLTDSGAGIFSRAYDEKNGVVGKLFGFTILSRSYVLGYTVPQQSSRAARVILPTVPPCCAGIKIPSKTLWGR